jgi:DNA-binding response OmpR family regulator
MNKKRILLIEDEVDIANLYKLAFEVEGFEIETALTGKEGLEKIKVSASEGGTKFDLVLLDLLLPDISGIDILKDIKSGEETKSVPFLILTNYASDQIKYLTSDKNLANTPYLIKINITPQQLVESVKKTLEEKSV